MRLDHDTEEAIRTTIVLYSQVLKRMQSLTNYLISSRAEASVLAIFKCVIT